MKSWQTTDGNTIIRVLSGRSNSFLLTNGKQHILIDTGPKNMWKKLQNRLIALHIDHIDFLILTHAHFDHAGNAHKIKEKYNSRVIVHRNDAANLAAGDNIIVSGTNFITRIMTTLFAESFFAHAHYEPCKAHILVDSVLDLNVTGFKARIISTPGHTKGCISVIINDEIALVGDAMFGFFKGSVMPPFANDVRQMVQSWGMLLETTCSIFLPSHGSAINRELVQREFNKK